MSLQQNPSPVRGTINLTLEGKRKERDGVRHLPSLGRTSQTPTPVPVPLETRDPSPTDRSESTHPVLDLNRINKVLSDKKISFFLVRLLGPREDLQRLSGARLTLETDTRETKSDPGSSRGFSPEIRRVGRSSWVRPESPTEPP